jgi:hypothetical protein
MLYRPVKEDRKAGLKLLISFPEQVIQWNLGESLKLVSGIGQIQYFTSHTFCRLFETFQIIPITTQQGLYLKLMGPREKMGVLEFFDTDHLLAERFWAHIEEIHKTD